MQTQTQTRTKNAYVTFLIRGDGYLPGALVLAHALKMQSKNDCLCLVTHDISRRARHALGTVYDRVIEVPELCIKSGVGTGRDDRNLLMTRFEALRLTDYKKIILLDADVLPLSGYDSLFELPTPAGIIMEHKEECYSAGTPESEKWSWHNLYEPICPHGAYIPREITDRVARNPSNMGVNAGLWVLTPSQAEYENIVNALHVQETMKLVKNFPWPEMQLATMLWSGQWTNVDIRYCSIGGYPSVDILHGIHYAGLKPWQIKSRSAGHYARFSDFVLWRQFYWAVYWSNACLHDYPMLKRLGEFCRKNKR